MLTHLQLRDFVIVEEVDLEFGPGLTALTGETGAGKSIVVDALLMIAGSRGGGDVVRQGAQRAEVTASFGALPTPATEWLDAQAIEHEGDVIVRRVVGLDGRSRAFVNGQLVPIQQLREFTELLIEIHGQQEFQHLVNRAAQRALLDAMLAPPAQDLGARVAGMSQAVRDCRRDHATLEEAAANRDSRLELLRYQLGELKAEITTAGALEELFIEQKRLAGSGRLSSAARGALDAIYDADAGSAHDLIAKATAALRAVGDSDPALAGPTRLLAEATLLTSEAAQALRHYLDHLDADPARQEEIERRAAAVETLARKHRRPVLELPAEMARIEQELETLDQAAVHLSTLEQTLARLEADYAAAAGELTRARRHAAGELGQRISALMQTLGMAGGRFAVSVEPGATPFAAHGADEIEFLVSANPGQPLKSLSKVASGGELSRISLAVQVAAAGQSSSLCRVFDEVDSGIGGGIAEIVGRQLRDLGARSQVLCVTHLAQVAAQAHTQCRVVKQTDGQHTRTLVKRLNDADRVLEVARMLGGLTITEQARAHAQEMLQSAAAETAAAKPSRPAASAAKSGRARSSSR